MCCCSREKLATLRSPSSFARCNNSSKNPSQCGKHGPINSVQTTIITASLAHQQRLKQTKRNQESRRILDGSQREIERKKVREREKERTLTESREILKKSSRNLQGNSQSRTGS